MPPDSTAVVVRSMSSAGATSSQRRGEVSYHYNAYRRGAPHIFFTTMEYLIALFDNEVFGTEKEQHRLYCTRITLDRSSHKKVDICQRRIRQTGQPILTPEKALQHLANNYSDGTTVYTTAHPIKPMCGTNVYSATEVKEPVEICVLRLDGKENRLVEFPVPGSRCLDISFPDSDEEREPHILVQDRPVRNPFDCVRPMVAENILRYLRFVGLPLRRLRVHYGDETCGHLFMIPKTLSRICQSECHRLQIDNSRKLGFASAPKDQPAINVEMLKLWDHEKYERDVVLEVKFRLFRCHSAVNKFLFTKASFGSHHVRTIFLDSDNSFKSLLEAEFAMGMDRREPLPFNTPVEVRSPMQLDDAPSSTGDIVHASMASAGFDQLARAADSTDGGSQESQSAETTPVYQFGPPASATASPTSTTDSPVLLINSSARDTSNKPAAVANDSITPVLGEEQDVQLDYSGHSDDEAGKIVDAIKARQKASESGTSRQLFRSNTPIISDFRKDLVISSDSDSEEEYASPMSTLQSPPQSATEATDTGDGEGDPPLPEQSGPAGNKPAEESSTQPGGDDSGKKGGDDSGKKGGDDSGKKDDNSDPNKPDDDGPTKPSDDDVSLADNFQCIWTLGNNGVTQFRPLTHFDKGDHDVKPRFVADTFSNMSTDASNEEWKEKVRQALFLDFYAEAKDTEKILAFFRNAFKKLRAELKLPFLEHASVAQAAFVFSNIAPTIGRDRAHEWLREMCSTHSIVEKENRAKFMQNNPGADSWLERQKKAPTWFVAGRYQSPEVLQEALHPLLRQRKATIEVELDVLVKRCRAAESEAEELDQKKANIQLHLDQFDRDTEEAQKELSNLQQEHSELMLEMDQLKNAHSKILEESAKAKATAEAEAKTLVAAATVEAENLKLKVKSELASAQANLKRENGAIDSLVASKTELRKDLDDLQKEADTLQQSIDSKRKELEEQVNLSDMINSGALLDKGTTATTTTAAVTTANVTQSTQSGDITSTVTYVVPASGNQGDVTVRSVATQKGCYLDDSERLLDSRCDDDESERSPRKGYSLGEHNYGLSDKVLPFDDDFMKRNFQHTTTESGRVDFAVAWSTEGNKQFIPRHTSSMVEDISSGDEKQYKYCAPQGIEMPKDLEGAELLYTQLISNQHGRAAAMSHFQGMFQQPVALKLTPESISSFFQESSSGHIEAELSVMSTVKKSKKKKYDKDIRDTVSKLLDLGVLSPEKNNNIPSAKDKPTTDTNNEPQNKPTGQAPGKPSDDPPGNRKDNPPATPAEKPHDESADTVVWVDTGAGTAAQDPILLSSDNAANEEPPAVEENLDQDIQMDLDETVIEEPVEAQERTEVSATAASSSPSERRTLRSRVATGALKNVLQKPSLSSILPGGKRKKPDSDASASLTSESSSDESSVSSVSLRSGAGPPKRKPDKRRKVAGSDNSGKGKSQTGGKGRNKGRKAKKVPKSVEHLPTSSESESEHQITVIENTTAAAVANVSPAAADSNVDFLSLLSNAPAVEMSDISEPNTPLKTVESPAPEPASSSSKKKKPIPWDQAFAEGKKTVFERSNTTSKRITRRARELAMYQLWSTGAAVDEASIERTLLDLDFSQELIGFIIPNKKEKLAKHEYFGDVPVLVFNLQHDGPRKSLMGHSIPTTWPRALAKRKFEDEGKAPKKKSAKPKVDAHFEYWCPIPFPGTEVLHGLTKHFVGKLQEDVFPKLVLYHDGKQKIYDRDGKVMDNGTFIEETGGYQTNRTFCMICNDQGIRSQDGLGSHYRKYHYKIQFACAYCPCLAKDQRKVKDLNELRKSKNFGKTDWAGITAEAEIHPSFGVAGHHKYQSMCQNPEGMKNHPCWGYISEGKCKDKILSGSQLPIKVIEAVKQQVKELTQAEWDYQRGCFYLAFDAFDAARQARKAILKAVPRFIEEGVVFDAKVHTLPSMLAVFSDPGLRRASRLKPADFSAVIPAGPAAAKPSSSGTTSNKDKDE